MNTAAGAGGRGHGGVRAGGPPESGPAGPGARGRAGPAVRVRGHGGDAHPEGGAQVRFEWRGNAQLTDWMAADVGFFIFNFFQRPRGGLPRGGLPPRGPRRLHGGLRQVSLHVNGGELIHRSAD